MNHYNLDHSYNKYSGKKLKESLSSFLPHLPGNIDTPGDQDNRYFDKISSNSMYKLYLTLKLIYFSVL